MLGLLLVDHGSRNAESNAQLLEMATLVGRMAPGVPIAVAHLEVAEPGIAKGFAALVAAGATRVQVLTYFLGDGRHSREDIPRQVAEAAAAHPGVAWSVAPPLGPHHLLARLLLARAGIPSTALTPAEHAAAVLEWLRGHDPASVVRELRFPGGDNPVPAAATALAEAADSSSDAERAAGISALFAGLVEPLNDGFTPAGRAVYADLFVRVAWQVCSRTAALLDGLARFGVRTRDDLAGRYERARGATERAPASARRIAVLSRVTIGADIALSSLALVRLRQRYPDAELLLLGDGKLAGLFGGLPGVRVVPVPYTRRGPLAERFRSWLALVDALAVEGCDLVVAPDSRLDQLGVLPVVADERRYLLWEGVQPDGEPPRPLGELLDDWLRARLGLPEGPAALPVIALDAPAREIAERLRAALGPRPIAAVKLDHGGNPAKALPRAAEAELLRRLRARGWRVLLDRGFGADELASSDALLAAVGWTAADIDDAGKGLGADARALAPGALAGADVVRFYGSIAGWAGACAACGLAVSYDSVGHHLAAALGVPVVTAFAGYADDAFPIAWRPRGRGRVSAVEFADDAKERPAEWERWFAAIPAAPR